MPFKAVQDICVLYPAHQVIFEMIFSRTDRRHTRIAAATQKERG